MASIFDSLLGKTASNAANTAAADTYAKQQAATQAAQTGLTGAGNQYNTGMQGIAGQYPGLAAGYDPYAQAGGSALDQLLGGLGLGGNGGAAFTEAYQSLPGYKEGLNTGTNAALRGADAAGMLNSGRTLKGLQRFGSDYEAQKSGDYLNRLLGLTGLGYNATGAQAGILGQGLGVQQQGLQGQLGANTSAFQDVFQGGLASAPTIGQGQVAGANAEQQGISNLLGTGAFLGGSYLGGRSSTPSSGATVNPLAFLMGPSGSQPRVGPFGG